MTPYINNSKIGWGSAKKSDIREELLKGAQIKGTQYGIPFNKSVEMLTYNKDLLDKYGVKVPKTMSELRMVTLRLLVQLDIFQATFLTKRLLCL